MVVCFAGDGDVQMTLNEFQTAVQYRANVILVVVNNGIHGTIRMHQEREYPGRPVATDITSPDYAALARSHGWPRRACRPHRGFRHRLRARRGQRQAGDHRGEIRSRSDLALRHALPDQRKGKALASTPSFRRKPESTSFLRPCHDQRHAHLPPCHRGNPARLRGFFAARGAPKYCWCMVWRRSSAEAKTADPASRKRQMMQRIAAGMPVGLIAYDGETPVGWVFHRAARELPQSRWPAGGNPARSSGRSRASSCRAGCVATDWCAASSPAPSPTRGSRAPPRWRLTRCRRDAPSYGFMGYVPVFAEAGFADLGMAASAATSCASRLAAISPPAQPSHRAPPPRSSPRPKARRWSRDS